MPGRVGESALSRPSDGAELVCPWTMAAHQDRCGVYVHQPRFASELTDEARRHDQYGVHWWLQRALAWHPWRVQHPKNASVIFFNASLTYANLAYSAYRHEDPLHTPPEVPSLDTLPDAHQYEHTALELYTELTNSTPRPGVELYTELKRSKLRQLSASAGKAGNQCAADEPVWFAVSFRDRWGAHQLKGQRPPVPSTPCFRWVREVETAAFWKGLAPTVPPLIAPFVVASPPWLLGGDKVSPPALLPWKRRKLLFFAGHIPMLHISNVRWNLWRELQEDQRVTLSATGLLEQVRHARACRHFNVKRTPSRRRPSGRQQDNARSPAAQMEAEPLAMLDYLRSDCMELCQTHGEMFLRGCASSPNEACASDPLRRQVRREKSTEPNLRLSMNLSAGVGRCSVRSRPGTCSSIARFSRRTTCLAQ